MSSRPSTPPNPPALVTNGLTGSSNSPQTPVNHNFSLTEYAANPSPGTLSRTESHDYGVPEEFLLPNGTPDYLRLILTSKVYEVVKETPLTHAVNLSNRYDTNVLLKREDLQPVFSFKLRGAYNKMAHLSREDRWKGVVACSAGNHAQGVAYSARHLRIPATIVMPEGTPTIKHTNVSRLGGHVVLHGEDFDAAKEESAKLAARHDLTQIPPFDDPYVIAGQGTIGMEILRQTNLSELEAIFCCIGGGGLIAGVGIYVKRIAPHVKIIGVETYDANAMVQSLKAGKRINLKEVGLFADGAAVKCVGNEPFRVCREVIDEVIQVTTDEICAAIKDTFEDTRSILEPAGALSLAGLKKYVKNNPDDRKRKGLVAIASGANMNFDRLRFVAERAAIGECRESILMVRIKERPGSVLKLIGHINPLMVSEFRYRYAGGEDAIILVGVEHQIHSRESDMKNLFKRLESDGMKPTDLSDDELVKSHLRYLIGGPSNAANERLFSFEFPERGGALYKFLSLLHPSIGISMFHYRNYGADVGKVLVAFQVTSTDEENLQSFLNKLGYRYKEETNSEVYKTFLRNHPDSTPSPLSPGPSPLPSFTPSYSASPLA